MDVTTKPLVFDADNGGQIEHLPFLVRSLERSGASGSAERVAKTDTGASGGPESSENLAPNEPEALREAPCRCWYDAFCL